MYQKIRGLFRNSKEKLKKVKKSSLQNTKLKLKLMIQFKAIIFQKVFREPSLKKSTETFSRELLNRLNLLLKVLELRRAKLMRLCQLEDQREFQRFGSQYNNFSMERNRILVSMLTKQPVMVQLYKAESFVVKTMKLKICSLLLLPLFLLVLKLLVVL